MKKVIFHQIPLNSVFFERHWSYINQNFEYRKFLKTKKSGGTITGNDFYSFAPFSKVYINEI